jgi:hypothetical protein
VDEIAAGVALFEPAALLGAQRLGVGGGLSAANACL